MDQLTIVGLGEILWDVLDDAEKLGGAPVNFAHHVNSLGATGIPISTIGDDDRGRRALAELENHGLRIDAISLDPDHPTGYVNANVDEFGVAHYAFPDDIAWDHLSLNDVARSVTTNLHAVCFGTLAQRTAISRAAMADFLDRVPATAIKVFDLNLRQKFYNREVIEASLKRCDVLKLSDEELQVITAMFGLPQKEREALAALVATFGLQLAVVTRGKNGSILVSPAQLSEHTGFPVTVADTIGAGDAFTAATTLGFLLGHDLATINAHANRLAAYVCAQEGAMPAIPAELKLIKSV